MSFPPSLGTVVTPESVMPESSPASAADARAALTIVASAHAKEKAARRENKIMPVLRRDPIQITRGWPRTLRRFSRDRGVILPLQSTLYERPAACTECE